MNGSPARRPFPHLTAALLLLGAPSCGPSSAALYPVQGKVLYAGRPAVGAIVTFLPLQTDEKTPPRLSGQVRGDGSFELITPPNRVGAPAGEYAVAVTWLESKDKAGPLTGEVPNRLPVRYADPQTSGLRATVAAGPNNLPPFQLTK